MQFVSPVHGADKARCFAEHDLMVIPSFTELSPNVALEARASGLPVLLTKETGLSEAFTSGMMLRSLQTPAEIAAAIREAMENYPSLATKAGEDLPQRSWRDIAGEFLRLL